MSTPAVRTLSEPDTGPILLIDDEESNLDLLEDILRRKGFASVVRTSDARQAVPLFESVAPELVLLDLHMPYRSGFEILADLRQLTPPDEYLPVLVLTADATFAAKQRALREGAHDFLTKPFVNAEVVLRVMNLLRTRTLYRDQRNALQAAERAEERSRLLAEVSRILSFSLDARAALVRVTQLLTPGFADAADALLCDTGEAVRSGLSSGAPPLRPSASPANRPHGLERVGGSGDGLVDDVRWTARAPDLTEEAHSLAANVVAAGKEIGRLVFWRHPSRPPFDTADAAFVEEVAHRAALAVEHLRMFIEARTATEERERILTVVAHDLRTPLCALLIDTEMMMEGAWGADPAVAETAGRMFQAAQRMNGLIQDLLEVTRTDRGVFALELGAHEIRALLTEAENLLRPVVEASGLEFRVHRNGLPLRVRCDDARVLQVLSNLVGNAAKFAPAPGRVEVTYEERGGECRVSVRDTGPGIPPEQLPHLFGSFWQGKYADRRGLGLGLAIARGIVEAHEGRIWAESEPDNGTSFIFTLPLAPAVLAP